MGGEVRVMGIEVDSYQAGISDRFNLQFIKKFIDDSGFIGRLFFTLG